MLDTLARGLQAAGHDVLLYATGDSTCPVPTEWTFDEALGTVETGAASELLHAIQAYRRSSNGTPTSSTTTRSSARSTASGSTCPS